MRNHLDKENIEDVFPMSDIQLGMLYHSLLEPDRPVYYSQMVFQSRAPDFAPGLFNSAVELMTEKHPILRTGFNLRGSGEPLQIVFKTITPDVDHADISDLDKREQEKYVDSFLREDRSNTFDLSVPAPLWKMRTFSIGSESILLLWIFHHAVSDGWSTASLMTELYNTYLQLKSDPGYVPPKLKNTYKQFVLQERREKKNKKLLQYWKEELSGYKRLNFPQNPDGERMTPGKIIYSKDLGREIREKLNRAAADYGLSFRNLSFAAYIFMLNMLSVDAEVTAGWVTHSRPVCEDGDKIIGCFLNTIPVRIRIPQQIKWRDYIRLVDEKISELSQYNYLSLPEIARIAGEENKEQNPLFDTFLNFVDFFVYDQLETVDISGGEAENDEEALSVDGNDQSNALLDFEIIASGGDFVIKLMYTPVRLSNELVQRLAGYFEQIINKFLHSPGDIVNKEELMSSEERQTLLYRFNKTAVEYPRKTIHELFEEQVSENGGKVAVIGKAHVAPAEGGDGDTNRRSPATADDAVTLTYGELNEKSNRLAGLLKAKGIGADTVVGLMPNRSVDMLIGLMAVLKAGGAYLPIDPQYPEERIAYVLKDSAVSILLTRRSVMEQMSGKVYAGEIVFLDESSSYEDNAAENESTDTSTPTNLAYVIYTSGSTGKPKGVAIEHRNVINFMTGVIGKIEFSIGKSILALTTLSFDIFVLETLLPLLNGLKIVIADEEQQKDPLLLAGKVVRESVELMQMTPSTLKLLSGGDAGLRCLENVEALMVGGEAFPQDVFDGLKKNYSGRIYNMYGPTETTVWSSIRDLTGADKIDIGTPISNTRIYIIDHRSTLLPLGVVGELCIGGDGLGRGYLNRPGLTEERFVCVNFDLEERISGSRKKNDDGAQAPGRAEGSFPTRLYRTGDLARWLPDGNIQCLGRIDSQVKLRGFRIELEEIENQLLKHDEIKETVVIVKTDGKGDKYLCAYIVSIKDKESLKNGEFDQQSVLELRSFLSSKLPDYMIPSYFVPLDAIPLTPNGKIDRKALPDTDFGPIAHLYTPPRNKLESQLARIWSEVLGIEKEKISIDSNFFAIGGHSLKATVMVGKVHKELNVHLPLGEIFKTPTIRVLSEYIKELNEEQFVSIRPTEKKEYYRLSSAQKRLYFLQEMDHQGMTYNLPGVAVLEGNLDIGKLENAFERLVERHESLRTSFQRVNDEPAQQIHDNVNFKIEGLPFSKPRPANDFIRTVIRPFDLTRAPLLRVGLMKEEEHKYILVTDMHHIIADGVSLGVIVNEMMNLYSGKELPEPRLQYKDFSQWQNSEEIIASLKEQETYWLKEFDGEIPVLDLPYDFARPRIQSYEGSDLPFELGMESSATVKKYALEQGTTLYMVLLTVYNIFLARISNREDIVVGTPIAGRNRSDLEYVVGMFVNTLALRNFPIGEKSVGQFLEEVKKRTLDSFSNQDYLYEELVENVSVTRDIGRNPLFDTMYMMQNFDIPEMQVPGLNLKPYPYEQNVSKFDLTLQSIESDDLVFCNFEYASKLFKATTIERFVGYFKKILSHVVENPTVKIADIEIITDEEKRKILFEFNDTERQYPDDKTIHELFEEQVERTPDRIAAVGTQNDFLTYMQLSQMSNQSARVLRQRKVRPDTIVGIMATRSVDMLIGIFGILKAGAAYLPIDPQFPENRIAYMLKDSKTDILLTQKNVLEKVAGNIHNGEIIDLNQQPLNDSEAAGKSIENTSVATDLAYVIYTSGSTGKPKGVALEHRNVVNFITGITEKIEFSAEKSILALTTISFDIFVLETLLSLLKGLKVVVADEAQQKDPRLLVEKIVNESVDLLQMTPSTLKLLSSGDIGLSCLENVEALMVGGEAFPQDVFEGLKKSYNGSIYNMYGPTETTVWSSLRDLTDLDKIDIGIPIANTRIHILDRRDHLLPMGVAGELCIGGDGLARGYLNRPELTEEKFRRIYLDIDEQILGSGAKDKAGMQTPHLTEAPLDSRLSIRGSRFYRTGDLARWLPDGNIQCLGRIDSQVKLRGFRIELGEIEIQLLAHEEIKEAVVVIKADGKGDKYLCAYIVSIKGKESFKTGKLNEQTVLELRSFLSSKLPDYMIPSYFVSMDAIPLTPNGKIDRKALPEPDFGPEAHLYTPPRNKLESRLARIWSEVLDIEAEKISIDSNFFAIGGHSLKATVMVGKVHKELNVHLPLGEIFNTSTIRGLAVYIKELNEDLFVSIQPAEKKEYYPVSSAQRRLFLLQQMDNRGTTYNLPTALILEGNLDMDEFERTFKQLISRHESLRTSFHRVKNEPVQIVHDDVEFKIEGLQGEQPHQAMEDGGVTSFIRNFIRPFDLSSGPLFRVDLIEKAEGNYILVMDMHHIISDGVSAGLLTREFVALYNGEELPGNAAAVTYKDYARWQNTDEVKQSIKQQEAYWLKEFEGELPVLHLPNDFLRPRVQSFEGSSLGFDIDLKSTQALKTYALEKDTTLFTVLLAAFNTFLFKLSGQEDIVVGSPIAGRRHSDLEHIVGMFVNTLALRNFPGDGKSFESFLDEVKVRTLDAFSNQDYLYEELVEKTSVTRDPGRNPLFDAVFMLQNMDIPEINITGLTLKPYDIQPDTAKFDLMLSCTEDEEALECRIEYCTKLFKPSTIERFKTYFKNLISCVIGNPSAKLADIEIIPEAEVRKILYDFNDTKREYPKDKTIHQLFEELAEVAGDHIALVGPSVTPRIHDNKIHLSYHELDTRAGQLAQLLMEKGVECGTIVGIMAEPSLEMILGVLAILKAGAAYLPINPEYPPDRKRYLLKDGNVGKLLTNRRQIIPPDFDREIIYLEDPAIYVHARERRCIGEHRGGPHDLAYIIYTSGSTGGPKGVMVEHRNVVRLVKDTSYVRFNRGDRILQTGALEFDASTFEIWGALLNRLELHLAPRDTLLTAVKLKKIINSGRITTMWMTAPLFNQMTDADIEIFGGLQNLLVGGDVLSPSHINRVRNYYPRLQVINGYGPTENTTFSTTFTVDEDYGANIPIGSPITNSTAYIVDKYNRTVPIGVQGELLVGGDGVARGYLNNPELTEAKFICLDVEAQISDTRKEDKNGALASGPGRIEGPSGSRLYRTGDLARRLPDGNIEFLGRIDQQVKIRGFRIECGEIETRLKEHPDILEAVVLKLLNNDGEKYLCAYLVLKNDLKHDDIRRHLSEKLPDYMMPANFMQVDRIPLNPNGKIDRKALPVPEVKSDVDHAAPENDIQAALLNIWAEVLGIKKEVIGIDSNFFELGGHSLRATLLTARIHKEFDILMPLTEVFSSPTIRESAQWITAAGITPYVPIPLTELQDHYALSHAQKRVWALSQMEAASIAFNIHMTLMLEGNLDVPVFKRVFETLVARHESLRTVFITIDGEPKQKILAPENSGFKVEYMELEEGPDNIEKAHRHLQRQSIIPFDLSRGPLLRICLTRLSQDKYMFFLNMHHIIGDFLSFNVLFREMFSLYDSFIEGESNPLEPLSIQYKDYAAWHNEQLHGRQLSQHREYWRNQLKGRLPRLELPLDKERPAIQTYNGGEVMLTLDQVFFEKLKDFSESRDVTLFMTLLTTLNLLFYHYTGQTDIIMGAIIAGREHADLHGQVGYFLNTLALRNQFNTRGTFTTVLDNVKTILTEAYQHQLYPFDKLVEDLGATMDRSRHPIFDVVVDMLNVTAEEESTSTPDGRSGIEMEGLKLPTEVTKFDLTFYFYEKAEDMEIRLEYNTDLFHPTTAERMMERLKTLLTTILDKPDSAISTLRVERKVKAPMIRRISRG